MPKGLAIPLGVTPKGGAAVVDSALNDNKIVMLALGDDTNSNAFQQNIGLGPGFTFDINDPQFKARVMLKLRTIFNRFQAQRRYQLSEDSIQWAGPDDPGVEEGTITLTFKYWSLEANEERLFSQPYRPSTGGA